MQLSDIENMVRQDLFDPAGANQRWSAADIDRAIDKAVDRYSAYYPNILFVDMQSQPFQRTYPYPTPLNANYPVWWIERIIYPLQMYGSQFAPPATAPNAAPAPGTTLGIGVYKYGVTFLSQGGETPISPLASVTTTSGNQTVTLSNIPIGPSAPQVPGVAINSVIGRNIYRSLVGGTTLFYLATIQDNLTSTYSDSAADSTLANMPAPPSVNTAGVMLWPPLERNFAEHSDIWDSSTALANGGNMGAMGAVGEASSPLATITKSFTLQLNSASLPRDTLLIMRVFYATKHQLDAFGSTIPELHRDIIVLGACAYAMEAYQIPANDNFVLQDGGLRDHLDDTAVPRAWAAAAKNKMDQFASRLEEVKRQRDYAASSKAHWGEVQRFWPRL